MLRLAEGAGQVVQLLDLLLALGYRLSLGIAFHLKRVSHRSLEHLSLFLLLLPGQYRLLDPFLYDLSLLGLEDLLLCLFELVDGRQY